MDLTGPVFLVKLRLQADSNNRFSPGAPMQLASTNAVSPATLLKLGRVSNLPTVWSNVLAGTALALGVIQDWRTCMVVLAMSLLYVGGMYLNDYFDRAI